MKFLTLLESLEMVMVLMEFENHRYREHRHSKIYHIISLCWWSLRTYIERQWAQEQQFHWQPARWWSKPKYQVIMILSWEIIILFLVIIILFLVIIILNAIVLSCAWIISWWLSRISVFGDDQFDCDVRRFVLDSPSDLESQWCICPPRRVEKGRPTRRCRLNRQQCYWTKPFTGIWQVACRINYIWHHSDGNGCGLSSKYGQGKK